VTARANPPPEAREYTDQLYYDAPVFSTTLLRWLVEDVGVKHVLLRTDHPFELRDMDPLETGAGLGLPPGFDPDGRRWDAAAPNVLAGRRGPCGDGPEASVACAAWQTPPAWPW